MVGMLEYMRGTEGVTKGENKTKLGKKQVGRSQKEKEKEKEKVVSAMGWGWWKLVGVVSAESCIG